MIKNFSPAVVTKAVKDHLMRIEQAAAKPQHEKPAQHHKKAASAPSPGHEEL